ncbi:alpha/beta hydrolase [Konateibacter massiliensis]|uniref:alpha/beta hydrolase n=1 Tax=Konateibacter massiliensis TaxID=2002841 RepID=UPI001F2C797C|nr:alpha/beta hydrolase [Konateibacter massiliensis]
MKNIFVLMFSRWNLSIPFLGKIINNGICVMNQVYSLITGKSIMASKMKTQAKTYKFGRWRVPKGYTNTEIILKKAKGYLLKKENTSHKKIVYQLHGGGYVETFKDTYNEMALRYSKSYDNADVFSLNYRTAPDHLYPSALEDALDGYEWLLKNGYSAKDIVVCGDSAGGGLALALTLYLRDHEKQLPKLLILSSPWADFLASGESYSTKIKKDAFFGSASTKRAPKYPVPIIYAGDYDLTLPYISPAYGDYRGMPPMLIQTGSDELLLSDSVAIVRKAKEAGVEVRFIKYWGMYHTFYIITPYIKEGCDAWNEIKRFIKMHE